MTFADEDSTPVLAFWRYLGSGYLNPGDVLPAAGVEASIRVGREALFDLRRGPPGGGGREGSRVCPPTTTGMPTRSLNCLSMATAGLQLQRDTTGDLVRALVRGRVYQRAETYRPARFPSRSRRP
jgi:hypothetical protein